MQKGKTGVNRFFYKSGVPQADDQTVMEQPSTLARNAGGGSRGRDRALRLTNYRRSPIGLVRAPAPHRRGTTRRDPMSLLNQSTPHPPAELGRHRGRTEAHIPASTLRSMVPRVTHQTLTLPQSGIPPGGSSANVAIYYGPDRPTTLGREYASRPVRHGLPTRKPTLYRRRVGDQQDSSWE